MPVHSCPQGRDFTFVTEGGLTFEEWVDTAADRAMAAEAAEAAARAVAEEEATAAALAAALQRDEDEARSEIEGEPCKGRGCKQIGSWGPRLAHFLDAGASSKFSCLARFALQPPELRANRTSYQAGALARCTVKGPDGAEVLLWSAQPSPVLAGGRTTLLYNSKAGPLAWLDPDQGHAAPKLTFGFNNWRVKGGAGLEMTPSSAMPVRR
jgi:hypothetical protein